MNRLLVHILLLLYPRNWRKRYGNEIHALINELEHNRERSRLATVGGLVAGAIRERAQALRVHTAAIGASLALVAAAITAVVVVADGGSGLASGQSAASTGTLVVAQVYERRIKRELRSTIKTLCSEATVGRRVTAIEMDPRTGAVLGKTAKTCSTTE